MNPVEPGIQTYATPNADFNNNGIPDIREILDGYISDGHNDFSETLERIETLVEIAPGDPNVIFMSDGYGHLDEEIAARVVANLNEDDINITAFGIGIYSTIETIKKIDPAAVQLTDVEKFVDILAGWDESYAIEPLMEGVTVYLDSNNNGEFDLEEPWQVTSGEDSPSILGSNPAHYTFDNLLPGTYTVRAVLPESFSATASPLGFYEVGVSSDGESFDRFVGLNKAAPVPNQAPKFLTTAPVGSLEPGESFVYKANAQDPDADPVTYSRSPKSRRDERRCRNWGGSLGADVTTNRRILCVPSRNPSPIGSKGLGRFRRRYR